MFIPMLQYMAYCKANANVNAMRPPAIAQVLSPAHPEMYRAMVA
jgi:hypothetical protein